MAPLSPNEIQQHLKSLHGWSLIDNQLSRTYKFHNFLAGINFIDHLALLAEAAQHHPDIDIRYTSITLRLTTHDAGGITKKDFALAEQANKLIP
jgi:4a-hydroxytetrahydrobiopterin dehydratase